MAIKKHYIGQVWYFDETKMSLLGKITRQRYSKTDYEYWYSTDNSKADIEAFKVAKDNAIKESEAWHKVHKMQCHDN